MTRDWLSLTVLRPGMGGVTAIVTGPGWPQATMRSLRDIFRPRNVPTDPNTTKWYGDRSGDYLISGPSHQPPPHRSPSSPTTSPTPSSPTTSPTPTSPTTSPTPTSPLRRVSSCVQNFGVTRRWKRTEDDTRAVDHGGCFPREVVVEIGPRRTTYCLVRRVRD